jgi:hypothetical protein
MWEHEEGDTVTMGFSESDLKYRFLRDRKAAATVNIEWKTKLLPGAFLMLLIAPPVLAQRLPVDYVNTLIGTAPMTDKVYLGNNPAPGEELYSGTVNPCAMVPDPGGYLCVGPVTSFDGAYHVRGSGYRFDDATIMGFTQMNGEYSDENRLLFMPTIGPNKDQLW